MNQTPARNRIKPNWRGLMELMLACAFLSLLTCVVWSWQVNGSVTAMEMDQGMVPPSLLSKSLQSRVIMLSLAVAEFVTLLAAALVIAPVHWWLRADHILGSSRHGAATPFQWVGQKIQQIGNPEPQSQQIGVNEAGEPIYYYPPAAGVAPSASDQLVAGQPVPGQAVPGQPQPGQPVPGQPVPGQPTPGQAVPGQPAPGQPAPGQPAPGQPVPGQAAPNQTDPAAANQAQPGADAPSAPLSDVLNFEETEEDDPLADLANLGDILSSAFDEDLGVDQDLAALAHSLDDLDIATVKAKTQEVFASFAR